MKSMKELGWFPNAKPLTEKEIRLKREIESSRKPKPKKEKPKSDEPELI
jgi:hypothetical protein